MRPERPAAEYLCAECELSPLHSLTLPKKSPVADPVIVSNRQKTQFMKQG
jgi:hypothetical protein